MFVIRRAIGPYQLDLNGMDQPHTQKIVLLSGRSNLVSQVGVSVRETYKVSYTYETSGWPFQSSQAGFQPSSLMVFVPWHSVSDQPASLCP